jgi:alanine racemase
MEMQKSTVRPTFAEIDLDAIARNLEVMRHIVGSARVLAVVKADAYGHGIVPVAKRLEAAGVDGFGVALAEEGLELRAAGIKSSILVLNGVYAHAYREVLRAGLTPVVYDAATARAFGHAVRASRTRAKTASIHVKVDTGMSRLGVQPRALAGFLDEVEAIGNVRVAGVMTHLAAAEHDEEFTAEQLARFRNAVELVKGRGHTLSILHAANSAATMRPAARFDMVRPGLALYGVAPPTFANDAGLVPAFRLRSLVIALRTIERGETVGYDRTFVASRTTRIATVPLGYGDGLLWRASGRGFMLVRGKRCPIAGRVSMDLSTLDVTDVPDVEIGDEVVALGRQGAAEITAIEAAQWADTIPYEVLTSISRRVPRLYVES